MVLSNDLIPENFPSFSEGLSLRRFADDTPHAAYSPFPFLFGGAFIEALDETLKGLTPSEEFPFLFGGAFIEAGRTRPLPCRGRGFPFLFGGAFIEAVL